MSKLKPCWPIRLTPNHPRRRSLHTRLGQIAQHENLLKTSCIYETGIATNPNSYQKETQFQQPHLKPASNFLHPPSLQHTKDSQQRSLATNALTGSRSSSAKLAPRAVLMKRPHHIRITPTHTMITLNVQKASTRRACTSSTTKYLKLARAPEETTDWPRQQLTYIHGKKDSFCEWAKCQLNVFDATWRESVADILGTGGGCSRILARKGVRGSQKQCGNYLSNKRKGESVFFFLQPVDLDFVRACAVVV